MGLFLFSKSISRLTAGGCWRGWSREGRVSDRLRPLAALVNCRPITSESRATSRVRRPKLSSRRLDRGRSDRSRRGGEIARLWGDRWEWKPGGGGFSRCDLDADGLYPVWLLAAERQVSENLRDLESWLPRWLDSSFLEMLVHESAAKKRSDEWAMKT